MTRRSDQHQLPVLLAIIVLVSSILLPQPLQANTNSAFLETEKRLLENQRNMYRLRKERDELQQELRVALLRQERGTDSEDVRELIADLRDSIDIGDTIIDNLNDTISRQRLLLSTMERATAPSTLDMAINKALNANLSELAQNLADNEQARQDVARLRSLLKQQAGLGIRYEETPSSVSYAAEQQLAEDEFLRLLELFSSNYEEQPSQDIKAIKITGIENGEPFSINRQLSYLGHSQYHLETVVHEGKMTFTVDGRPWHMTVPPEEDKATYIIIYDVAGSEQPRLVLFNKSLLGE